MIRRILAAVGLVCSILVFARPVHAQWRSMPGWVVEGRGAVGRTMLIDAVDKGCEEIRRDFSSVGLRPTCDGDDSGVGWALGFDLLYVLGPLFDVGARIDYTKPADLTKRFTGTLDSASLTGDGFAEGRTVGIGGQFGYSPVPRVRVYGVAGARHFDYDRGSTVRLTGPGRPPQTESSRQNYSGWGPRFSAGIDYSVHARVGVYFEGGRVWLKNDRIAVGEGVFHERLSMLMFGVVFRFWYPF